MGRIKWYKRDPSAALNGMMELTLEERGAYNTVLDLIYSRDGLLADDDRFIAGWLRVDLRVWKRIKSTLIERGKLFVADGILRNSRADAEVLVALSRVTSAQHAGVISARSKASKSGTKSKENRKIGSTTVPTTVSTTVSTNHNHNQKEVESKLSPSPRAKKFNPLLDHELPDWLPREVWLRWIRYRHEAKRQVTLEGAQSQIDSLAALYAQGHDPRDVVEQSVSRSWIGLFKIDKEEKTSAKQQSQPARASTRDIGQAVAEKLERTAKAQRSRGDADIVHDLGPPGWPH